MDAWSRVRLRIDGASAGLHRGVMAAEDDRPLHALRAISAVKILVAGVVELSTRRADLSGLPVSNELLSELGVWVPDGRLVDVVDVLAVEGRLMSEVTGSEERLKTYLRAWGAAAIAEGFIVTVKRRGYSGEVTDDEIAALVARRAGSAAGSAWFKRSARHGMDPWEPWPEPTDEQEWAAELDPYGRLYGPLPSPGA